MQFATCVQIRQHNDWDILDFFNTNDVKYSLIGDHMFIVHGRKRDMHARPGDWLSIGRDGDVEVESGVFDLHAQHAIEQAHQGRR